MHSTRHCITYLDIISYVRLIWGEETIAMEYGRRFFENGEFRLKFSITIELLSPENAPEFSILGVTQLVSYRQS